MADDLEMLKMLRSMFTGSVPTNKQNKAMTDEFMKDERYPTSPAYQYHEPTEKPLESVEAPWEMLLPTMRALKAAKLLKEGVKIKDLEKVKDLLRSEPASKALMQRIEPKVRSATGYSKKSTEAILRDLNRKNPRSKRMYEKIDKIDLNKAFLPRHEGRPTIHSALDSLGFEGKKQVVDDSFQMIDNKILSTIIDTPLGKMRYGDYIVLNKK